MKRCQICKCHVMDEMVIKSENFEYVCNDCIKIKEEIESLNEPKIIRINEEFKKEIFSNAA